MPLPERYRCCRKSLPVTEDFLSLLDERRGRTLALFFPVRRKGSEESVKGMVSFMESAFIRFIICCRPWDFPKEALIKSLFAFILEFLCNARNGLTRIASYLRKPMTKQCIKILIKENSMN